MEKVNGSTGELAREVIALTWQWIYREGEVARQAAARLAEISAQHGADAAAAMWRRRAEGQG